MSNNRLCACQCGGVLRNKGRYISGHSLQSAHLWRGKDRKPDSKKNTTTIICRNDGGVAAPEPVVNNEPPWVPTPQEWYIAKVEKRIPGAIIFRLTNHDLVFAHHSVMPPGFHGPSASIRIERSDRGVRWRALEVQPYIGEEL